MLRGFGRMHDSSTHRRYVSVRGDRCQTDLDLAFIVDGSGSIESYFPGVRAFIADVVQYFEIGAERSRVALVAYSDNAVLAFNFNGEQTPRDPVAPQGKRAIPGDSSIATNRPQRASMQHSPRFVHAIPSRRVGIWDG